MNSTTLLVVVAIACVSLTGCIYQPVEIPTTDASASSSPYQHVEVHVDRMGERRNLQVLISDHAVKDVEFRKMVLLSATLITDSGEEISLGTPDFATYGLGVTYWFDLNRRKCTENDFRLRITTSLNGKVSTTTGNFSTHTHTKWVNVLDQLNG